MEIAYDHIQEEVLAPAPDQSSGWKGKDAEKPAESLNEEFQEAYKAISASPWGVRFGSILGSVKKQGESYYESSKREYATVSEQATKGLSELRTNIANRTRGLSLSGSLPQLVLDPLSEDEDSQEGETSKDGATLGESEGLLSKLKKGAAQRVSEIEAAEARADEYLIKFGSSIGSFLRDAVTIDPPEESMGEGGSKEVVFEAKGHEEGKRQIYAKGKCDLPISTTRLDAQLHLLHGNLELFKIDSEAESFKEWSNGFSAIDRTGQISGDLERYPELRSTMEKLVPDSVQYADFWRRYYFLRNELDMEEQRRKELLKGATLDEEEVGWDEDDESDAEGAAKERSASAVAAVAASTETLIPKEGRSKPKSSIDRASQPDSEASYDVVSGAPSKTPSQTTGSPPTTQVAGHTAKEVDTDDDEDEEGDDEEDDDEEDEDEEGDDEESGEDDASSEEDWE